MLRRRAVRQLKGSQFSNAQLEYSSQFWICHFFFFWRVAVVLRQAFPVTAIAALELTLYTMLVWN